jgi:hypothetical protein
MLSWAVYHEVETTTVLSSRVVPALPSWRVGPDSLAQHPQSGGMLSLVP